MENDNSKAVKAGFWYTICNILLKGIAFITLPIFTRLLTTSEYGLYNAYVAYELILTVFVGLCLYGSLRPAKYEFRNNYDEYAGSVLFLSVFVVIAFLLVGNIFYTQIDPFFEFDRIIFNILILHSYAMFVFQFYNIKLALNFQYKSFLIASFLNSFLGTVVSLVLILFVFTGDKYIGRIYGYALIPIIIAAFIAYKIIGYNVKNKKPLINKKMWKFGLVISLPLVVHTFSQQLLGQFGRIMINKLVGASEAGIYSFILTVVSILQIVILSFDNAWSAWFYEKLDVKDYKDIYKQSKLYILLVSVIFMGFITVAPEIVYVMAPAEYRAGLGLLIPLSFSMYLTFLYSLPVHIEYFYRKTKFIAIGTTLATIINVGLVLLLINEFGYFFVGWASVISYTCLFVFHWIIAKRIDGNKMFSQSSLLINIAMCVVYAIIINNFMSSVIIRYFIMIIVLCIVGFYKRKDIAVVMQGLFHKRKSK